MRTLEDIVKTAGYQPEELKVAIKTIISRCNFDYNFFSKVVLNNDIPNFHSEIIKHVKMQRYMLIILPRGHLKTTVYSENLSIWRLWRETNKEICLTSSALDQSQRTIENIQKRISDNEFLEALVPQNRSDTWNKHQLNTTTGNRCFLKPFNDSARGSHVDYFIADDILRSKDISQEQIKDIFWSVFFPMVQTRRGQILLVGTPMTQTDLFADIQNEPQYKEWKVFKTSAVKFDIDGSWLEPTWNHFTLNDFQKFRTQQGSLIFEREFLVNPLATGSSIFKKIKTGSHQLSKARENCTYYLGIDVAFETGTKADFLVFSIIEKDKNGKLWQVKQERYQGKSDEFIIDRSKQLNKDFRFRKILIESKGVGKGPSITMTSKEKCPELSMVTEAFPTSRPKKEDLISTTQSAFESEDLIVLDNDILINELNSFKLKEGNDGKITYEGVGAHDDCVIALMLSVFAAMEQIGKASFSFI